MRIIGILLCIGLAIASSYQLHRKLQVRASMPGPPAMSYPIINLWTGASSRGEPVYYVTWDDPKHTKLGQNWDSIDYTYWATLHVGDKIQVVRFSDHEKYEKGVGFESPGNIAFDIGLLMVEIGGALGLAWLIKRDWKNNDEDTL